MSVALERIGKKAVKTKVFAFDPAQDVEADSPWGLFSETPRHDGGLKPSCPCHLLESGDPFLNRRMGAEERKDPSPS